MRKEIQFSLDEMRQLKQGAKNQKERYLSHHIKKCALKQNAEYIRYQFNDMPKPLKNRMGWDNIKTMTSKDMIGDKNEENVL